MGDSGSSYAWALQRLSALIRIQNVVLRSELGLRCYSSDGVGALYCYDWLAFSYILGWGS